VSDEEAVAEGRAAIEAEAPAVGRATDDRAEAAGVGTLADAGTGGGAEEAPDVEPGVPDKPPCQKAATTTAPTTRTSAARSQVRGSRKPAILVTIQAGCEGEPEEPPLPMRYASSR
jgi:hypothetical protein